MEELNLRRPQGFGVKGEGKENRGGRGQPVVRKMVWKKTQYFFLTQNVQVEMNSTEVIATEHLSEHAS